MASRRRSATLWAAVSALWHQCEGICFTVTGLSVLLAVLSVAFGWLILQLLVAMTPYRALQAYERGDYNRSAALFERVQTPQGHYDAAGAWYRAGDFERALALYTAAEQGDAAFDARVRYNKGNALVRLKEFAKARETYAHALALQFDEQALENMMHILHAEEQDHMLTGRQKGKKRAEQQQSETQDTAHKKEGGGSNQPSSAERRSGAGAQGKKVERDPRLEFSNKGANRLSSKQYELINQRSVHEDKPW